MSTLKTIVIAAGLALGACSSTSPVEDDFGNSVRQMQNAQTLDREKRAHPSDAPVIGADAYAINAAIEALRKDVPKREEVKQDIIINVGGK